MAKSNRLAQVLSELQKEESLLEAQLGRVKNAIAALAGVAGNAKARSRVRETTAVARKARKMTAAQRKAVGLRMKKYWAERRKAKG